MSLTACTAAVQLPPRLPAWLTLAQLQTQWARFCGEYHEPPHRALTAQCGRPTTPLAFLLHQLPPDVVYPLYLIGQPVGAPDLLRAGAEALGLDSSPRKGKAVFTWGLLVVKR